MELDQDFKVVVTEEAGGLAGLIAGRVAGATGRPAAILNRQGRRVLRRFRPRWGDQRGPLRRALHGETPYGRVGRTPQCRRPLGDLGNFDAFVAGVNEAVRAQHAANPEVFVPAIEVDAEIPLSEISNGLLDWHERLAPFGSGNYRPVFVTGGLKIVGSRQIWEGMNLLRLEGGAQGEDGRRGG